jgi:lysophospholipase L1-like esterase
MKIFLCTIWLISFLADDPDPLRFKEEINGFKESDIIHPPPQEVFLFVGSSSIRMWKTLETDFKGFPVLNRGFGGSHFSDLIYYYNDLIARYKPSKIIIYEGDNDIASEKTPDEVFNDFKILWKMISEKLPNPEIAVIAPKPSPSRWHLKDLYESLNSKIETFCKNQKNLTYIDVYKPMLNEQGRPEPELFLEDSLHMNDKGYEIWKNLVLPFIEKNTAQE